MSDLDGTSLAGPTGVIAGVVRDVATGEAVAFAGIEALAADARRAVDTSGASIAGVVSEGVGASARPFAGAVVSAMAPGLADSPTAISDRRGRYRLRGLRPGTYELTIYYQLIDRGAIELRRTDIDVRAGRATQVDLEIDLRRQ